MAEKTGISLHIGVNLLDPAGYPLDPPDDRWPDGWDGLLRGCHFDAYAMYRIATTTGFEAKLLLSEEATVDNVKAEVRKAADRLSDGDIFFLSFAGHGGMVPDLSGDEASDEWDEDEWDETWCLHDRHLIDDEQQVMFADFKPGVRILVLSDSCHSGTVNRGTADQDSLPGIRAMSRQTAHACYFARKEEYDRIQRELRPVTPDDVKASVVLIAACQEEQTAGDGFPNGQFTSAVLKIWNDGRFEGSYRQLHEKIVDELRKKYEQDQEAHNRGDLEYAPELQSPALSIGRQNDDFVESRPFSI